ncbi:MAG TPA: hypothetical protein VF138_08590 [Caulobacteraceae bacterium]
MRKLLLAAGFAAAALIPSAALAQQSCEPARDTSSAGVAASVINALLGAPAARTDCAHVYGYYDANGVWHANQVNSAQAQGYYDAQGRWVAGAPNGYYDSQGRWVQAASSPSASGYYDQQGRWVPASASNNGYYDAAGRWIAPSASGYYMNGRWVAGPATGRYDANGRWIAGEPAGHRDAHGVWVADVQPGYYDSNGRWRAGQVSGYYDAQGRWVATAPTGGYGQQPYGYGQQTWSGAPQDILGRTTWLEQRIRTGMANSSLSGKEGRRALHQLQIIRKQERNLSHQGGQLTQRGVVRMQARLDRVASRLTWTSPNRWQN